jgi:hypothetical protein
VSSPVGLAATSTGASGTSGGTGEKRSTRDRASLRMHHPSPDGSLSQPGTEFDHIDFQFNPKDLTVAKTAAWHRDTGKGSKKSAPPQYRGPQPSKLSLEMFFDASETQDDSVVANVEKLFACCVPTAESLAQNNGSPPWVRFKWGTMTGFVAYISSVSAKYTLFASGGTPIRATCTVTLEELAGEPPKQNPTSGGLTPRRVHVLTAGDTLAGVAYAEYGNPALWRDVARINEIDDPLRLRPGTRLLLPTAGDLRHTPRRMAPYGDVEVAHAQ